MRKVSAFVATFLLLALLGTVLAGCGGSGSGGTSSSQPGEDVGTMDNMQQRANNAVREANLKMIDNAIQVYYAENGAYPTGVNQLTRFFASGVPVDPAGGTYYIVSQGGVAKAAVR